MLSHSSKRRRGIRDERREPACAHARTHTHARAQVRSSHRLCESQNAAPEGCCVSDVCIVYSVVPVHVGDCCTLRPHSGLVLFTTTGADSRLLSRRAERQREEEGGGGDRRKQKEIIDNIFFFFLPSHRYLFTHGFLSLILLRL